MNIIEQKENETRLNYLVRVAIELLRENAYKMDTIVYDGYECDSLCLAEDLEIELNFSKP